MGDFLKIKDLAKLLGVTRQTIHNMLKDERFPVKPLPDLSPRRWRREDVEAWLNSNNR